MKLNLNNSAHVKLCLLSQGVRVDLKALKFVGQKYAEDRYLYANSNKTADLPPLPSEIVLPDEIVAGLHIRQNSPWLITVGKNDKLQLFLRNSVICEINFAPRPGFFDKKLKNGILCQQIVNMYGLRFLSFFTRGWCYFALEGIPCKFCGLTQTRKDVGKSNLTTISPAIAQEAAQIAFANDKRIGFVNHVAGAHKNNDLGIKLQMDIITAVRSVAPKNIMQHLITIPPDNLNLLQELKKAGLNTIAFNLEVYDRRLFKKICPGKDKFYGYDRYMEAYSAALHVFGEKNVYCVFVCGIEPLESLIRGIYEMSAKGITPAINVFHTCPGSIFEKKKHPTCEYIWKVTKAQAEVYKKYKFKPDFPGGTRNSFDSEVSLGYFD